MRTRIAKLDDGQKRHPRLGARWQGMRLNMMARQPANGMAEQGLKDCDHARLKASEADNLIDRHYVIGCQPHLIQLGPRFIINDVRRAGELAGILGDLCQPSVAFARGVRARQRGKKGSVMVTEPLNAAGLGNRQCGA